MSVEESGTLTVAMKVRWTEPSLVVATVANLAVCSACTTAACWVDWSESYLAGGRAVLTVYVWVHRTVDWTAHKWGLSLVARSAVQKGLTSVGETE